MMAAEQVRSFISIELPEKVRAALGRIQGKLKAGGQFPVKWVNPDSIHLTLKFLGNVDTNMIDGINGAMDKAARDIPPFHLELGGLGVFPNLVRVQIVWVGINGDLEEINSLQREIESNLVPLGFARESRSFTPHLTLARLRDHATQDQRQSIGRLITSTQFEEIYSIDVDSVDLMKSQLTGEGAIYSRISCVKLGKDLANNH